MVLDWLCVVMLWVVKIDYGVVAGGHGLLGVDMV